MQALEMILSALVTLVAAFAGAWYAFRLSDRDKARQVERGEAAAINRIQFALIQQVNILKLIQAQSIDPVRDHPGRFIAMRALLPVRERRPRLDADCLSFLLETEDRELPFAVMIEQDRFETALQAVDERSRFHLDVVQPRLAAAGIRERVDYLPGDVKSALGEDVLLRLQRATGEAILHVDRTIESTSSLVATLHRAMKARYPRQQFIRLGENKPSNTPLQPTSGEPDVSLAKQS